jgi:hypothetical protein
MSLWIRRYGCNLLYRGGVRFRTAVLKSDGFRKSFFSIIKGEL